MSSPRNDLGELYMILRDPKKLASVMICQEISQRELARDIGWKSHSYLGRLLRGEVRTLDGDAALRISHRLGLPVDHLFLTRLSNESARPVQQKSSRKRPAA